MPNSSKTTFLKPTFYGLLDSAHTLTVQDFYPNGKFISIDTLNTLTGSNSMQMQYNNLKFHIKSKIGVNKTYDAIPKLILPQKMHTHATLTSLMASTKKGSGTYRKIISRSHKQTDVHNPARWKAKLSDNLVTRFHVKQSMLNLQSMYISSDMADILSRFKLGKTLFKNQLFHIGITDTPSCNTCSREQGTDITENITHACYDCIFISSIISDVTTAFFPNIYNQFQQRDIILATITNNHPLYEGKIGQQLASIIWDTFLVYILKSRNNAQTPVAAICLHEIRSQLNKILKILPHSLVALYIKARPQLQTLINQNEIFSN